MTDVLKYITENVQHLYYVLSAIAVLYTFYKFLQLKFKDSNFLISLNMVFDMPTKLDHIKNVQSDMYYQIQLQNKISNCILDSLDIAEMVCDSEGKCIKVNAKWISLTGLSESESLGHNWLIAITSPEDREYVKNKWYDMIDNNTPFEETFFYQNRITKQITKVKCTASDILDESKKRVYILALSRVVGANTLE
jgi:PAS domain S-box-containing protein